MKNVKQNAPKTKPMDNNTQLPAEVRDRIKKRLQIEEKNRGLIEENKSLKNQNPAYNDNKMLLRQKNDKARSLLEKFISRHEAGLLPDRFIYDEIKTFLDGTK
jgi:hypothetical protein